LKTVVLEKVGRVATHEVAEPTPPKGGIVVEIKAALTCGTDVKAMLRGHPKMPMPSPLGHEFSGVVSAVGAGVTNLAVGDPIMAVHSAPCGECFYCRKDLTNLCESAMDTKVLGAFAEKIVLPEHIVRQNLLPKPESLDFAAAAFLEPLACVMHGIHLAKPHSEETVVVFGAGPIGLLFLMMLRLEGCRVIVIEPSRMRRAVAEKLGAAHTIGSGEGALESVLELTEGYGADLAIECTGVTQVWSGAIDYLRRGGALLLFGGTPSDTQVCFDTNRLHYDQIFVMGCFHFRPVDVQHAAQLLIDGKLDPTPLISGETDLAGVEEALRKVSRGEGVKYLVRP
jgi:L-iditol 2-dehydrogenase